ncbi:MAG: nitroreductase family deazaflavin-dependent oxidoreductase [Ktedonobacteraceae bacterium]|nr:nitroreductase family deazaflavin-dependent oxidoreductase [Ktedonobacteraceae bacterium]MBO0789714.1 nitroreductase family deazaflavin-dependent oxidoreductase [Ktedonobacteraceae bacterium]
MKEMRDWNRQIIEEFRSNGGKVGGPFAGAPLLLLTTTGARSGMARTTPVMYLPDGERLIIFASKAGASTNPDWYHNLMAHPQATVEVGSETFEVTASEVTGEQRDQLYARQAALYPGFADYQAKTTRRIPVIALQR